MTRLPSLAARNVLRNHRRSAVTLAAIGVGVAMLTLLNGFTTGARELMLQDVVQGRTGALQIHRAGYLDDLEGNPTRLNMPYSEEMLGRIRAVTGVTGVTGRLQFNGLVSNGVSQTMFVGRGIDPTREREVCPRSGGEVKAGGEWLSANDGAQALVGYELAQSLSLTTVAQKEAGRPEPAGLSDFLSVQSSSPEGRANAMELRVKGLTASTFPFENKRVLTLPLSTAQELLGLEGKVTEYAVGVAELSQLEQVAGRLRAALGPEYEVHSWDQLQPFVRDVINRHFIVLGAIGFVLFVIVLAGIANTMLMSVFERVREIGTMLAVGVRRREVLFLFVLEALLLGFLGGVAGALVGRVALLALAARGITLKLSGTSAESVLRPTVSASFLFLCVAVAVAGALVSSAYPAWRASRLNPVDALRAV